MDFWSISRLNEKEREGEREIEDKKGRVELKKWRKIDEKRKRKEQE